MTEHTQLEYLQEKCHPENQSQPLLAEVPQSWVERIFDRLSAFYGVKFADLWRDGDLDEIKDTWRDCLTGYSAQEIKRGLDACKTKIWPPTLPEFLMLCRPPIDAEAAFSEASKQMAARDSGCDVWSNPAIYWAAVRVGAFDLKNGSWATMKARWVKALNDVLSQESILPVPRRMPSLPAVGATTTSKTDAQARINKIKKDLANKFRGKCL